jgi:bacillithiol system protein YtxJ
MNWNNLIDIDQLNKIVADSENKPQLIFKHSTRCVISKMVLSEFEKSYRDDSQSADLYFLDLLQFRVVSNQIAQQFKVRHESPQVLLVRNGVAVRHDSHDSISASVVETWIAENK